MSQQVLTGIVDISFIENVHWGTGKGVENIGELGEWFVIPSKFLQKLYPEGLENTTYQEAGTKVGLDQFRLPVRVGSTQIVSDHEKKHKIKWNWNFYPFEG